MKSLVTTCIMFGLAVVGQAAGVQIDFGQSSGNGQSGWTELGSSVSQGQGDDTLTTTVDGMTVTLEGNRWKTRNAITDGPFAGLSDMLYDFGGANEGTTTTLTLDLPAGSYDVVIYHHESKRSEAESAILTLTDADDTYAVEEVFFSFGISP
jgi:hypothetical protein